jgi:hypothetical protein
MRKDVDKQLEKKIVIQSMLLQLEISSNLWRFWEIISRKGFKVAANDTNCSKNGRFVSKLYRENLRSNARERALHYIKCWKCSSD